MEDRITKSTGTRSLNDLPEHLLLHILSFLPTWHSLQTTLLSRKWRNLWSLVPSLDFDYPVFIPQDQSFETCLFFSNFIDRTLLTRSHSPSLNDFHLQFDYFDDYYHSHLDTWLRYAVDRRSTVIDLDFFVHRNIRTYHVPDPPDRILYDFPFSVLQNGRVRVLKLCYCNLSMSTTMNLLTLRLIYLDQVFLTDEMVSGLIGGCPGLENLDLQFCGGMRDLKICSSKLKVLSLRYFHKDEGSLEISCPNLSSLYIICFEVGNYSFRDTSSVVNAQVSFLHKLSCYVYWSKVVRLLGHVKCLTVQNWWFKLLAPKDVFPQALNNLKHLELRSGYSKYDLLGIAALLELLPNVEKMIIDGLQKMDDDESLSEDILNQPINLCLPSMRQVTIKDFQGTKSEFEFVKLLKGGVVLQKIVLVPPKVGNTFNLPTLLVRQPNGKFSKPG